MPIACGAASMLRWPSARGPNSRGAVHPADDAAGGELVRDPLDERGVVELVDVLIVFPRRPGEMRGIDRRAPERMIGHVAIGVAEVDAIGVERRAERAAGIAGRGRHEHALEAGLREDARIGDAVQRHASAEAEIRQLRFLLQRARDVHERVLEHALHAGGAVGEAPAFGGLEVDRLVGRTRRPEELDEPRRIRSRRRRLVLEVLRDERERAVRRAADHLADLIDHGRTAVGGEPHHFVLVLVDREAEIRRERRVEHAERMRESDLAEERDARCRRPGAARRGRP